MFKIVASEGSEAASVRLGVIVFQLQTLEVAIMFNKIVQELGRTIKQTYTQVGNPADELVACAERCAADLIITGRRGLGNVGSLLQGSTSLRVNHLAKCACLSVA